MIAMDAPYGLFGSRLRAARKRAGKNQTELAVAVGVRQATVSSWELGTTIPALDTAARVARFLNISLDVLVPPEQPSSDQALDETPK